MITRRITAFTTALNAVLIVAVEVALYWRYWT